MKFNYLQIIILAFAPLVLRTTLYLLACKIRSIRITLMSCVILGGSGLLVSIIPIPLPMALSKVMAIGIAMFLMTRYTEAELYPDVVLIPLAVEVVAGVLTEFLLAPLAT